MKTLNVTRLSALKNKFGSYAYAVKAEDVAGFGGVYETPNGTVIYSRNMIGQQHKPTKVQFVERERDGVKFINFVDPKVEKVAELGNLVDLAGLAGFGAEARQIAAQNLFAGAGFSTQAVQAAQVQQVAQTPATPATATPVAEPPIEGTMTAEELQDEADREAAEAAKAAANANLNA